MLGVLVGKAWCAWRSHRCTMARVRQLVLKRRCRDLSCWYAHWRLAVSWNRTVAERSLLSDEVCALHEVFQKRVIMATALRFNLRVVSGCLLAWRSLAVDRAALAVLKKKVATRLAAMRVQRVFRSIEQWSSRQRVVRRIAARSLLHLRQSTLAKATTAWSDLVDAKQFRRSQELRLITAIATRWRRIALCQNFGRWRRWMVGVQHVRRILIGAKQRVDRARLARAVLRWAGYRAYCHVLAQRYQSIVERKQARLLVWSLLSWYGQAKAQLAQARRLQIAAQVAELHMARAERERVVASLREEFDARARALEGNLDVSNYKVAKTKAQARIFREEATSHYRSQQHALVERTQSEQAAVSALLDEAVSAAERNAQAAADALTKRLQAFGQQGHSAGAAGDAEAAGHRSSAADAVGETVHAELLPKEQAQHVRSLLLQINPTEGSAPSAAAATLSRSISIQQANHVRTMLRTALSPETTSQQQQQRQQQPAASSRSSSSNGSNGSVGREDSRQPQLLSDAARKRASIQAWAEASAIPLVAASTERSTERLSGDGGGLPRPIAPMPSAASIFSLSSSSVIDEDRDDGGNRVRESGADREDQRVRRSGRRQLSEMKRITVWIHAMADRRASRTLNDVFEAWVGWLVARVAPLQ